MATVGALLLGAGWIGPAHPDEHRGAAAFWRPGIPRPIAVRDGHASFRFPTRGPGSQMLVVVSSLSRGRGPYPIQLTALPTTRPETPETADDGPRVRPTVDTAGRAAGPSVPDVTLITPDRHPPRDRVFYLMVHEADPGDPNNYIAVHGILKGVGRRVQVYLASEDADRVSQGSIENIIATFDNHIYPAACENYGAARDVDGDGRFTVLLSSWLDHLGGGQHAVDGFVKVADLDASVPAPFGNRCDMMYLNAALTAGPYLRTLLAHEYMHAVVYSCKTLDRSDGTFLGPEEEGWLDEAMAHLAEDSHGFSPSNIDYRVSAFLSSPERYQLVVEDYFAANLFRSHGNRGSTYLFLRWCVDRYGPGLLPRLIRSPRRGVPNLEDATGATFAELYRRWSLAMFLSGLDPSDPISVGQRDGFRSIDLHGPWADWELAGPRYRTTTPGGPPDQWEAAGTTSHYVLVDGDTVGAVEVEVDGPPEALIQVTALPLGERRARISLSILASPGRSGDLQATASLVEKNGIPMRLSALAWEPLVPGPRRQGDAGPAGRMEMPEIARSFGTSALPARVALRSRPIPLPGISPDTGPIVFKLVGTDPLGRRVTAWAELDASRRVSAGDP